MLNGADAVGDLVTEAVVTAPPAAPPPAPFRRFLTAVGEGVGDWKSEIDWKALEGVLEDASATPEDLLAALVKPRPAETNVEVA